MDAIAILEQDHREIERLFAAFDEAHEADEQRAVFARLADALTIHTKIEEADFYPNVRATDTELIELSYEQHRQVKQMIADLLDLDPHDDQYAIRVSVLEQEMQQHIGQEEGELFPSVRRRYDVQMLEELGQRMMSTRAEIEAEAAGEEAVEEHAPI
jgi:hemerythrin superfamily protein